MFMKDKIESHFFYSQTYFFIKKINKIKIHKMLETKQLFVKCGISSHSLKKAKDTNK